MMRLNLLAGIGFLFIAIILNSCLLDMTPETVYVPAPTHIVAVAGNRMAIVSWQFPNAAINYEDDIYSVFYVDSGNVDENCYAYYYGNEYNDLVDSCAFPATGYSSIQKVQGSTQLSESDTVYGLTNGKTYVFWVTGIDNSLAGYAQSFGESNAVTPMATDTAR